MCVCVCVCMCACVRAFEMRSILFLIKTEPEISLTSTLEILCVMISAIGGDLYWRCLLQPPASVVVLVEVESGTFWLLVAPSLTAGNRVDTTAYERSTRYLLSVVQFIALCASCTKI